MTCKEEILNLIDSQITLNNTTEVAKINIANLSVDSTTSTDLNYDLPSSWSPWSGSNTCPKCGSHAIEVNNYAILTSYPAQAQLRCKDCGHLFGSGIFNSADTDKDNLDKLQQDQSILNIPKVGDPPYVPQVGDFPSYIQPWEQEPPSYPDIYIPSKESLVGWICPKCGKCWAPHIDSCSCSCSSTSSSIKLTY